jgi:hypothetical protein
MDNVTFLDFLQTDGTTTTWAIINKGNGEFQSMPKADYEASTLPSNSSTPQAGA